MIEFAETLALMRPLWLAAVPLIALVAWLAARRAAASGWAGLVDPALAAHLKARGLLRPVGRDWRIPALALSAAIVALALAGPATQEKTAPALRRLDTVVVVADMSRSLTEGGALEALRTSVARLLSGAGGRPVALVLFAAEAYLASPPSDDPRLLETLVAVLDGETMPDRGSRPDRALALAAEVALGTGARRNDVVLISDGGGVGAEAIHEAGLVRGAGGHVSAVFLAPPLQPYGMPQARREALAELVEAGGGRLVDAGEAGELAESLADAAAASARRDLAALTFRDHGRQVLWLALAPLLLLFRRRR